MGPGSFTYAGKLLGASLACATISTIVFVLMVLLIRMFNRPAFLMNVANRPMGSLVTVFFFVSGVSFLSVLAVW